MSLDVYSAAMPVEEATDAQFHALLDAVAARSR